MSEKRYYWLKLQEDFFDSLRVKKLRTLAGGDTFTIIYLKMQLKAIKTGGVLTWKGIENDFASELALDLAEEPQNVAVVLQYLLSCGLAETEDHVNFFLPWVEKNTGSETASTQRWREWKNRKVLESNTAPTLLQQNANVEKEIELEKESEIEREKDNSLSLKEKQEKEKRIAHFVELLHFAEQYGYDKAGTYRLAAEEGITQSEILAWREEHEARTM